MPDVVRYEREGGGLTFERVAFFADAVFAIALTLIVVGIGVPALTDTGDAGDLWRGLGDHFSASRAPRGELVVDRILEKRHRIPSAPSAH